MCTGGILYILHDYVYTLTLYYQSNKWYMSEIWDVFFLVETIYEYFISVQFVLCIPDPFVVTPSLPKAESSICYWHIPDFNSASLLLLNSDSSIYRDANSSWYFHSVTSNCRLCNLLAMFGRWDKFAYRLYIYLQSSSHSKRYLQFSEFLFPANFRKYLMYTYQ